jgi:hypothetical protein
MLMCNQVIQQQIYEKIQPTVNSCTASPIQVNETHIAGNVQITTESYSQFLQSSENSNFDLLR